MAYPSASGAPGRGFPFFVMAVLVTAIQEVTEMGYVN